MYMTLSVPTRLSRRTWVPVALVIAVLVATFSVGSMARAETTTTTAADTTSTTVAGDTTATTSAGVPTLIAESGLAPAPDGFEPPNPGLLATDMGIQFWPEFDTNDVLVLMNVTLPATTVFPYEFTFFVPTGARLAGIAEVDENGQFDYSLGVPKVVQGEIMDAITVTVPKRPVLQLEWYYDPGVGAPGQKSYELKFQVPADVGLLGAAVQQPGGATDFSAGPLFTQSATDPQGLTKYFAEFPAAKAGEMLTIPVQYNRTAAEPTIPTGGVSDPAQEQSTNYLLWMLVLLVVAAVGIVVYRLFIRKPPAPAPKAGSAARSAKGGSRSSGGKSGSSAQRGAKKPSSTGGSDAGPARFCTQCGGRLSKKDRFCPSCGAERDQ
jgi:hypothetical protein